MMQDVQIEDLLGAMVIYTGEGRIFDATSGVPTIVDRGAFGIVDRITGSPEGLFAFVTFPGIDAAIRIAVDDLKIIETG